MRTRIVAPAVTRYRGEVRSRPYCEITLQEDDVSPFEIDWNAVATDRGTTVSTAAAEDTTSNLTIANEALASGIYSATASSQHAGRYTTDIKATFADGTTKALTIGFHVYDARRYW